MNVCVPCFERLVLHKHLYDNKDGKCIPIRMLRRCLVLKFIHFGFQDLVWFLTVVPISFPWVLLFGYMHQVMFSPCFYHVECLDMWFVNVIERNIQSADLHMIHESTPRYVVRLSPYLRSWHPVYSFLHATVTFVPLPQALTTYYSLNTREEMQKIKWIWDVFHAGKSGTVCPRWILLLLHALFIS